MTLSSHVNLSQLYKRAQSGCVIIDRSNVGRIWAHGADRLSILQRISTNDLNGMSLHEVRPTVLTNPVGRIVDLLLVLNLDKRALLITSPGQSEAVQQWLNRFIFFQDEIELQDATSDLQQFGLYGPHASTIVANLVPGADVLPPHQARLLDQDSYVLRGAEPAGLGYDLIAPPAIMEELIALALDEGAVMAPSEIYDLLRVEAGLPGADHEISDDFIPLEVGLRQAISFTKGCYTGQEIIARMDSRGKLAKTMVGLLSQRQLSQGTTLRTTNGIAGLVTSCVHSPRLGWIGIGLVKPAVACTGSELETGKTETVVRATVTALPFDTGQGEV